MKVSMVETEKEVKHEKVQQVTATKEELIDVFKKSVIQVIHRLRKQEDMPPELGLLLTIAGADICAEVITTIFKEEK